jgi:hypothetical protein
MLKRSLAMDPYIQESTLKSSQPQSDVGDVSEGVAPAYPMMWLVEL